MKIMNDEIEKKIQTQIIKKIHEKEYDSTIEAIPQIIDALYANIPDNKRISYALFKDILSENDLVIVILEHIDYLLKLEEKRSPYGYAAYSISKLKEPLSAMKGELRKLKGVGRTTEGIILEILETGNSSYYEKLLKG